MLVSGGGHDEDVVLHRETDGALLDRRRLGAADREVHDLRAVLHGVDDRRRLVDVGDVAVGVDRLDDEQLRVAAEAGDADTVFDRAGGKRGDEGSVAEHVSHPVAVREDAPRLGRFVTHVRRAQVGAAVDHSDLDARRGMQHRIGNRVHVRRVPLPLPGDPGKEGRGERGLVDRQRPSQDGPLADGAGRLHDRGVQCRHGP